MADPVTTTPTDGMCRTARPAPRAHPRLLAVSHSGFAGGAEIMLARALTAAADRGWAVACAAPAGPIVSLLEDAGIPRLPIPSLKFPPGPTASRALRVGARTVRAASTLRQAARQADVVLANGLLALPSLRFAQPRAPVVWWVHDIWYRPGWRLCLRAGAPVVRAGVAVSEAAARPLADSPFPVTVVRNGTPWPVAPAPPDPPTPPVVGCAAAFVPWKGQDVLLEAVARLGRPDITIDLAATRSGEDRSFAAALCRRARRPDLAGRVRFLGTVPDVVDRMRTWSVAVLPSVQPEPSGLTLLEAMSVGVSCVATTGGGPEEVIGDAGLLVPPGDPGALAQALGRLLDDRELRRRCARAGRQEVASGLSSKATLEHLLDALAAVAFDTSTV